MAKVIEREIESQEISEFYPFWKIVIIGVISGILFWAFLYFIEKFIISPIFCKTVTDTIVCSNTLAVSGNISSILVAIVGILYMVKQKMLQPLIVSVTTAATLWGFAQWTNGLPIWEVMIWNVIGYLLSYLLFSWVVRYDRVWPVIVIIVAIVMAARIVANL